MVSTLETQSPMLPTTTSTKNCCADNHLISSTEKTIRPLQSVYEGSAGKMSSHPAVAAC